MTEHCFINTNTVTNSDDTRCVKYMRNIDWQSASCVKGFLVISATVSQLQWQHMEIFHNVQIDCLMSLINHVPRQLWHYFGPASILRQPFPCMNIHIIKIWRSWDRLIITTGFPILLSDILYWGGPLPGTTVLSGCDKFEYLVAQHRIVLFGGSSLKFVTEWSCHTKKYIEVNKKMCRIWDTNELNTRRWRHVCPRWLYHLM